MNYNEWCDLKANDFRVNMFPKPTGIYEGRDVLLKYLLGDDWYVQNPVSDDQVTTEMIGEIMLNYPSAKYRNYPWYKKLWLHIKSFLFNIPIDEYY